MKTQIEQMMGNDVLVTCDSWFLGHDGAQYRAVKGKLVGIFDDKATLGINTNERSTNWYIQVGRVIIAGCQIHYAINTDGLEVNIESEKKDEFYKGRYISLEIRSSIYNADF